MENASKALIIAGAILLSILIIAIGIYIFNNAQSTIENSMTSMSTQEKESFNSMFTIYEGKQTGSNVKALLQRLVANASTYKEERAKTPDLEGYYLKKNGSKDSCNTSKYCDLSSYVGKISEYRALVENKHPYYVTITYGRNGLVSEIRVDY